MTSLIHVYAGQRTMPTFWIRHPKFKFGKCRTYKNSILIPYETEIKGIANMLVKLQLVALLKFKIGIPCSSHYFIVMEDCHLRFDQNLLKRLLAQKRQLLKICNLIL